MPRARISISGDKLRELRHDWGGSQLELANAADMPRWIVAHAEAGYRPLAPSEAQHLRKTLARLTAQKERRRRELQALIDGPRAGRTNPDVAEVTTG